MEYINKFCKGKTVKSVVPQEDFRYWEIYFTDGTSLGIDTMNGDRNFKSQIGLLPSLLNADVDAQIPAPSKPESITD
jgi:hypothetical protein